MLKFFSQPEGFFSPGRLFDVLRRSLSEQSEPVAPQPAAAGSVAFRVLITPSARAEFEYLRDTYGLGDELRQWAQAIAGDVTAAKEPPAGVEFRAVLGEIEQQLSAPAQAGLRERYSAMGLLDRIKELTSEIMGHDRRELWIAARTFPALGGAVSVEVEAVYEIDRGARSVTFRMFSPFRPDDPGPWADLDPNQASAVSTASFPSAAPEPVPGTSNQAEADLHVDVGTPAWDRLTERRAELIHKKRRQGLTQDEVAEFDRLQQITRAAIQRTFPDPTAGLSAQLDALEERLAGGHTRPHQ